jgi:hypothetical protein
MQFSITGSFLGAILRRFHYRVFVKAGNYIDHIRISGNFNPFYSPKLRLFNQLCIRIAGGEALAKTGARLRHADSAHLAHSHAMARAMAFQPPFAAG